MRVWEFLHSTAMRLSAARCIGLFCLLAIALMACGGGTPPTDFPASGSTETPANALASVSAGGYHTCGVRPDRSVECWGSDISIYGSGQSSPPDGSFASVSAGGEHTCGVRTDGSVECWGANESPYGSGQASPPGDSLASFSIGGDITCGFSLDHYDYFECKEESGVSPDGRSTPPVGPFVWVSAGGYLTCGLRTDGSVECWGDDGTFATNSGLEYVNQPGGSFISVSAGGFHACGLRIDGSVECWGLNQSGETDAPAGSFDLVSAGEPTARTTPAA